MGPSGSGKTTFLNVLSGNIVRGTAIGGRVCVNGVPVLLSRLRCITAYVPQVGLVGCVEVCG